MKIKVFTTDLNDYVGVKVIGHANSGDYGEDIVCAGVSALFINLVNSIEKIAKLDYSYEENNENELRCDDEIVFMLKEKSEAGDVLMKSFVLGIQEIEDSYADFVSLEFEKVDLSL